MFKPVAIGAGILALTLATAAFTEAADVTGRVIRVDPGTQVIVLDNNQAYRVTPNTVVLVDNQPAGLQTLQPGQSVVIRSGEMVTVAPSASPPTAAPSGTITAPSGSTVVVQAPQVASAIPRQTVYGRVTDVDRGEIKVKTDGGSFEVKMAPEVAAQLRKGDTVRLDLSFTPSR